MALVLITPPTAEPVTLAEAKAHLRVDASTVEEDALISALIISARQVAEGSHLHRALVTQTWELLMDDFPRACNADRIEVPLPPLQTVSSITYIDEAGTTQTLAADQYVVDTKSEPGRIAPKFSWPSTQATLNAVTVRFTAGFGDAAVVPAAIKQGMLLLIGHLYEHREAVNIGNIVAELPLAVDALWAPYRVVRFV